MGCVVDGEKGGQVDWLNKTSRTDLRTMHAHMTLQHLQMRLATHRNVLVYAQKTRNGQTYIVGAQGCANMK